MGCATVRWRLDERVEGACWALVALGADRTSIRGSVWGVPKPKKVVTEVLEAEKARPAAIASSLVP
jgi:hypothetical protein